MPTSPTYPGVYIEEVPSGVRTIVGVATSITAFVGYTKRGLDHRATRVLSFGDFERLFGGLDAESELSYAVQQFFANGGGEAWIVRVPKNDATASSITLLDGTTAGAKKALKLTALSKGAWANDVLVDVDYDGIDPAQTASFNLSLTDLGTGEGERFTGVTMDPAKTNHVVAVVNDVNRGSRMVSVAVPDATAGRPAETGTVGGDVVLADLKNDDDYKVKVSADVPAGEIVNEEVVVISKGDPIPKSILGLCKVLERRVNEVLASKVAGAAVRCVPSHTGDGVRVQAAFSRELLDGSLDACITFTAGSAPSVLGTLKLSGAAATTNVGHYRLGKGRAAKGQADASAGKDGTVLPDTASLIGQESQFTGIYALGKVDLFNLLCIPDATRAKAGSPGQLDSNVSPNDIYGAALAYCEKRRAFLLVDAPPDVSNVDAAVDWISGGLTVRGANASATFPRLVASDPLDDFQPRVFAPSGVVAGLFARTDASDGVWKAPAGTSATLRGVQGFQYKLDDAENGILNPLGLNCLRSFPVYGNVSWGARTLYGADAKASEWKYVPVRRLALYIEETLFRGTKWAVFEPNDEPLWSQLRLNIGSFMHGLFRQGAFQGKTPRDAYLVKCDAETTTQADIDAGRVNVLVGFAPLKPAEFVVIRIQQLAGQNQA